MAKTMVSWQAFPSLAPRAPLFSRAPKPLSLPFQTPATQATVLTEDGAFALLFRPHLGGFDSSRVFTPGNLPRQKKMLMPGGQPREERGGRGGAWRSWN